MEQKLERILQKVQKPARYTGGELNQIIKDKDAVELRVAFCFPDTYEIGMSNLGLRIMYGVINEIDGVWCERVFAPWGDMEEQMRSAGVPLYSLESGDAIKDFDIIAFSLGYELSYTNVLNMLDLAGVPIRSKDREKNLSPLVIAGGACCYNPEPLADFIDMFVIGEGEEVVGEIIEALRTAKREKMDKHSFLNIASAIAGVYIPSLYEVTYNSDGTVGGITTQDGAMPVVKRIVQNMDDAFFPVKTIIPSTEIVHDRVVLEIFRGCVRGCRFCQAGHVNRPVRSRSREKLTELGIESLKESGYDEITLSSLSTSDYRELNRLCDNLLDWCETRKVGLSLPSLRADNFSIELMERVQKVRKSGLTFAPEAGSQRLRDVINKNVTEEGLLNTCRVAFEGGWSTIKLYFMLGLPTETDEDVIAIAELSRKVLYTWKQHAKNKNRGVRITVSTSCFVPKPHTPFQWERQVTMDEYMRRVMLLREAMRTKAISYNWHEPEMSYIEAVLARGDRRLGDVIEAAWRRGAKLDSWGEYFSFERWTASFEECDADPAFYAYRERTRKEKQPWDIISTGLEPGHLWREREAAYLGEITPDCRASCADCGASSLLRGGVCDA